MSSTEKGRGAEFRIEPDVKPYGGRRLRSARADGHGNIIGHISGVTADRVYRRADLSPVNAEAVDVIEEANRQRFAALARAPGESS